MAIKTPDKILSGPQLDILTAQKVFGWKNVHQHDGEIVGKKQDKAGRWRSAKVPSYSTDPVLAYAIDEIDERIKQLGKSEPYQKELAQNYSRQKTSTRVGDTGTASESGIESRAKLAPNLSKTGVFFFSFCTRRGGDGPD